MLIMNIATTIYEIFDFFSEYDYVFLYGTGKIAHSLMQFLKIHGKEPDGCCISHKTSEDSLESLTVYEFPEVNKPLSKCGFILAMREDFQIEVETKMSFQFVECGRLRLSKDLINLIDDFSNYESKNGTIQYEAWEKELRHLFSKPCVLMKRAKGIGDVLAFEPIARKFKALGYNVLVATLFNKVFRHCNSVDGSFSKVNISKSIERRCLTIDFEHAYGVRPYGNMVDGYVRFVQSILPHFSLPESERMPIYDSSLIHEHKGSIRKICVNNEATEWKSRIYPHEKMKQFVSYLKDIGYEIYEIGVNPDAYLGVGKNCFGMELHDSVTLMSEMDLYVGLDNGLMHLAQSIHLPIFVLFGCVCPLFRIHDWTRARVMWKNTDELYCAGCWSRRQLPCSIVECDREKLFCMDWSVEEVITAFETYPYNNPPKLNKEMFIPLQFARVIQK